MAGETTRNLRDAVITITDNASPTPNSVTVAADEGNLEWSVEQDVRQIMQRGAIDSLRKGDEKMIELSFTAKMTQLLGASCTLWEIVTGTGNAAAYTYTAKTGAGYDLADAGDVNVMQLIFTITQIEGGSEIITFPNCAWLGIGFSEGDDYDKMPYRFLCTNQLPIIT